MTEQLCENPEAHVHAGPCDGFGYNHQCSMCSGFVHRKKDGTLIHDDGTIFAPVKMFEQTYYEVDLPILLRRNVDKE